MALDTDAYLEVEGNPFPSLEIISSLNRRI